MDLLASIFGLLGRCGSSLPRAVGTGASEGGGIRRVPGRAADAGCSRAFLVNSLLCVSGLTGVAARGVAQFTSDRGWLLDGSEFDRRNVDRG